MSASRNSVMTNFGRSLSLKMQQYRPSKIRDIPKVITSHTPTLLARGTGKSYGDAALNEGGLLLTERLNRILAFDVTTGALTAEAGVLLADILKVTVPKGWMVPVLPGTQYITIGGALAANVHGKNQYCEGEFADHVTHFTLRLSDGTLITCSEQQNPSWFWATAAGYGLTGMIEEVTLQLKRIQSASLASVSKRILHMDMMIDAFEEARSQSNYMVGWIDHTASGDDLGSGIFSSAVHLSEEEGGLPLELFKPRSPRLSVPCTMPRFVLNRHHMALYNQWRFRKIKRERRHIESFEQFFHPLDNIKHWHRLYGHTGMLQYQFLIPESDQVRDQLHRLLKQIHEEGLFSCLAVIKYHGHHRGLLSFSRPGYSVALDFPATSKVRAFLSRFTERILEMGGRVYLAKDQILTAEQFGRMESNITAWQAIAGEMDPHHFWQSALSKRLQLKPEASE